jgi:hypothetical protein
LCSREQRLAALRERVAALKAERARRTQRRERYEAWVARDKAAATSASGSSLFSRYAAWELWEPEGNSEAEGDDDDDEAIREQPGFAALASDVEQRRAARAARRAEAMALKERGNTALRKGDAEGAVSLYTEAIALKRDERSLYTNRALALMRLGRVREAARDCTAAIDVFTHLEGLRPRGDAVHLKALLRRAQCHKLMGRWDAALEDGEAAAKWEDNPTGEAAAWLRAARAEHADLKRACGPADALAALASTAIGDVSTTARLAEALHAQVLSSEEAWLAFVSHAALNRVVEALGHEHQGHATLLKLLVSPHATGALPQLAQERLARSGLADRLVALLSRPSLPAKTLTATLQVLEQLTRTVRHADQRSPLELELRRVASPLGKALVTAAKRVDTRLPEVASSLGLLCACEGLHAAMETALSTADAGDIARRLFASAFADGSSGTLRRALEIITNLANLRVTREALASDEYGSLLGALIPQFAVAAARSRGVADAEAVEVATLVLGIWFNCSTESELAARIVTPELISALTRVAAEEGGFAWSVRARATGVAARALGGGRRDVLDAFAAAGGSETLLRLMTVALTRTEADGEFIIATATRGLAAATGVSQDIARRVAGQLRERGTQRLAEQLLAMQDDKVAANAAAILLNLALHADCRAPCASLIGPLITLIRDPRRADAARLNAAIAASRLATSVPGVVEQLREREAMAPMAQLLARSQRKQ